MNPSAAIFMPSGPSPSLSPHHPSGPFLPPQQPCRPLLPAGGPQLPTSGPLLPPSGPPAPATETGCLPLPPALQILLTPNSDTTDLPEEHGDFITYASKLGYPENLSTRVLSDLPNSTISERLEHLISLYSLLYPGEQHGRRRKDARNLPGYMISQDCHYYGKEKMPFWVWVKRETIAVSVTENPPHRRARTTSQSRSRLPSSSSSAFQSLPDSNRTRHPTTPF